MKLYTTYISILALTISLYAQPGGGRGPVAEAPVVVVVLEAEAPVAVVVLVVANVAQVVATGPGGEPCTDEA